MVKRLTTFRQTSYKLYNPTHIHSHVCICANVCVWETGKSCANKKKEKQNKKEMKKKKEMKRKIEWNNWTSGTNSGCMIWLYGLVLLYYAIWNKQIPAVSSKQQPGQYFNLVSSSIGTQTKTHIHAHNRHSWTLLKIEFQIFYSSQVSKVVFEMCFRVFHSHNASMSIRSVGVMGLSYVYQSTPTMTLSSIIWQRK